MERESLDRERGRRREDRGNRLYADAHGGGRLLRLPQRTMLFNKPVSVLDILWVRPNLATDHTTANRPHIPDTTAIAFKSLLNADIANARTLRPTKQGQGTNACSPHQDSPALQEGRRQEHRRSRSRKSSVCTFTTSAGRQINDSFHVDWNIAFRCSPLTPLSDKAARGGNCCSH